MHKSLGSVRLVNGHWSRFLFQINAVNFEIFIHQWILKNMFNIENNEMLKMMKINVSWAPNQPIKMISEGSCDIEDWSNDAENSALHNRNKLHFKMHSNRK